MPRSLAVADQTLEVNCAPQFGKLGIYAGVPIFVEHWGGIICNFTPILPYFEHWGGMNLDHDFVQVSNLSEDQKKGLHQKRNSFFPQIQVKTKRKGFTNNGTLFFPRI